jgi:hypothetical protein
MGMNGKLRAFAVYHRKKIRQYSLDSRMGHERAVRVDGYESFFVVPFYLQSVLVHSANCVKTCIQWHVEECSLALLCN